MVDVAVVFGGSDTTVDAGTAIIAIVQLIISLEMLSPFSLIG